MSFLLQLIVIVVMHICRINLRHSVEAEISSETQAKEMANNSVLFQDKAMVSVLSCTVHAAESTRDVMQSMELSEVHRDSLHRSLLAEMIAISWERAHATRQRSTARNYTVSSPGVQTQQPDQTQVSVVSVHGRNLGAFYAFTDNLHASMSDLRSIECTKVATLH